MPDLLDQIAERLRDMGNLRFLMEQQLDHIEALAERGLDTGAARDLLRMLMERDKNLRLRMLLTDADRWDAVA